MSTIFKVLSNLNHSGDLHKAGDFIEGELSEFQGLVNDKVLAIVEGAKSLNDAPKVAAASEAKAAAAAPQAPKQKDTWGPQPDPTPEELAAREAAAKGDKNVNKEPEVKPGAVGAGDQAPTGDNL